MNTKSKPKTPAAPKDAIALLRADHETISSLFADYEKTRSDAKKKALVAEICTVLTVNALIKEEIFYPAVKAALKDKILVPETTLEHVSIKALIAQLEGLESDGEMYAAKVRVLSEYVEHHVKEEQAEIFPKAKATSLDLIKLGTRMAALKVDLLTARSW
jgi:hemerythrin superfamily protein